MTPADIANGRAWSASSAFGVAAGAAEEAAFLIDQQKNVHRLLNKLSTTRISELSGFTKSYISQVKHGKCPPSQKLVNALIESPYSKKTDLNYLEAFLRSRTAMGCSPKTISFYKDLLVRFVANVNNYPKASRQQVEHSLVY